MKKYEVVEVEYEDWEKLEYMGIEEAVETLDNYTLLRGYLGGYDWESTDEYDYNKAKIYCAISKLVKKYKEEYMTDNG